ncbi:MAG: hypothetical protein D4R66_06530 [Opitutales bacterium]|nr:MAG: hypothetical protein D4R66_06530 [Opitutales bacterium]
MGQRERFILFLVGALLGVGILWGLNNKGNPAKEQHRRVRESLNLPGMMYDYAVTQKGFYGHYVKYESVTLQADGSQLRSVVTGGRRRYGSDGRELPEEYLWITETYAAGTPLAEAGPVIGYDFVYADRIALRLKPGHQPAEIILPSGDIAVMVAGKTDQAVLNLTKWQHLPAGAPWGNLPKLVRELNQHAAVASAELIRIDWKAEADLIKANSKQ